MGNSGGKDRFQPYHTKFGLIEFQIFTFRILG